MEKVLFAPLEGITGLVFRRTFHKYFKGVEEYYSPFLTPKQKIGLDKKDRKEVSPEANEGMKLIPQILSSEAKGFLHAARELSFYGYKEVNLNLGCPSGTVVNKGRGAGALKDLDSLEAFLYEVFDGASKEGLKLSIKSRIGYYKAEEFDSILKLFSSYPFSKLILHPRTRMEFYKGEVHREAFKEAMIFLREKREKLCFNGDIFTAEDFYSLKEELEGLSLFMIGRGFLKNPFLLSDILGSGEKEDRKEILYAFLQELFSAYKEDAGNEHVAVLKMKELWSYLGTSFLDEGNYLKELRKAKDGAEYRAAVNVIFSACSFKA